MFVDSHAHLEGERFGTDREQVIVRAKEAGIANIVALGAVAGPRRLGCAIDIADQYDFIRDTIATHPRHLSRDQESDFLGLDPLSNNEKLTAARENRVLDH